MSVVLDIVLEVDSTPRPIRSATHECHCGMQTDDRAEWQAHRNAHCRSCGHLTFGWLSLRGLCGECFR